MLFESWHHKVIVSLMVHHVCLARPRVHFVRHSESSVLSLFVVSVGQGKAVPRYLPQIPPHLANMQVHLLAKDKNFILFTSRTLEIQGFFVYFLFFITEENWEENLHTEWNSSVAFFLQNDWKFKRIAYKCDICNFFLENQTEFSDPTLEHLVYISQSDTCTDSTQPEFAIQWSHSWTKTTG